VYDGNGNTVAKLPYTLEAAGNGTLSVSLVLAGEICELFTYDGMNRLIEAEVNGVVAQYTYRTDGLRISKTVDGTATYFIWNGVNISAELDEYFDFSAKYIYGNQRIAGEDSNNVRKYYLYNAHGDVVQLTDDMGAVLWYYDYDAFGNEKNPDPNDTNAFRYCGEYYDTETGTIYLRARYYDPRIGRFTQQDGWEYMDPNDPLSLNLYTYCHNNPILYVDVSGNNPIMAIYLYVTAVATSPDTQMDVQFIANDLAEGDYVAAILDAVGVLVPGATGLGKTGKKVAEQVGGFLAKAGDEIATGVKTIFREKFSSRTLRNNMIKVGKEVPDFKNAAHHIIAGGSKEAEDARKILEKFGISINDASNGVFLPTVKGVSDAAYHPSLHTDKYYNLVNALLGRAQTKEDAIKILDIIGQGLTDGSFLKLIQ